MLYCSGLSRCLFLRLFLFCWLAIVAWFFSFFFVGFVPALLVFVRHQNGCDVLLGSVLRLLFIDLFVLPAEWLVVISGLTSLCHHMWLVFFVDLRAVLNQCLTLAPVFYRARIPSLCSALRVLALSQTVAGSFGT